MNEVWLTNLRTGEESLMAEWELYSLALTNYRGVVRLARLMSVTHACPWRVELKRDGVVRESAEIAEAGRIA